MDTGEAGSVANRAMTYLDAAVEVLEATGHPLTTREVIDEAIRRGLVKPTGKTPEATMSAALYCHVLKGEPKKVARVAEPGPGRARRGSVRWVASARV